MNNYFKQIIKDYFSSYNNQEGGFSRRKILATYIIVVICSIITFKYTDNKNIISILIAWFILAGLLLGFILFQQVVTLIQNIKGNNKDIETKKEEDGKI